MTGNAADNLKEIAKVQLKLPDAEIELPVLEGTMGERAIDIRALRGQTGYITLDEGYMNTGSCYSDITFIDGEKGVLLYRGLPITEVAQKMTFPECALMLINGAEPKKDELADFSERLTKHAMLHEGLRHHFEGFPPNAHPMAILSAMINSVSCYHPELLDKISDEHLHEAAAKLLSKVRTIAAFSYKKVRGEPIVYPDPSRDYVSNLLHMMFSKPFAEFHPPEEMIRAMRLFFILHADHEQNCSTSTCRMVGSSQANLFGSVAAAVCALWGPLHGGANMKVISMLERVAAGDIQLDTLVEKVKKKEELLWGFGHRVYKNFDPRSTILKNACDDLHKALNRNDRLLDIARQLEEIATNDEYFIERKLYPNVDFYSGILMRSVGIPTNMFTVMFAIGRMPGWIAHWKEGNATTSKISRPRQIYVGQPPRDLPPIDKR